MKGKKNWIGLVCVLTLLMSSYVFAQVNEADYPDISDKFENGVFQYLNDKINTNETELNVVENIQTVQSEQEKTQVNSLEEELQETDHQISFPYDYYKDDDPSFCVMEGGRVRYQMVVSAKTGSKKSYVLDKSIDAGVTYTQINAAPFEGKKGRGVDVSFLTQNFGFALLVHGDGDSTSLYVTRDGGKSFTPCEIEKVAYKDKDFELESVYWYATLPFLEDGKLVMYGLQGKNGNLNGGDTEGYGKFVSEDDGNSFCYVGRVRTNQNTQ